MACRLLLLWKEASSFNSDHSLGGGLHSFFFSGQLYTMSPFRERILLTKVLRGKHQTPQCWASCEPRLASLSSLPQSPGNPCVGCSANAPSGVTSRRTVLAPPLHSTITGHLPILQLQQCLHNPGDCHYHFHHCPQDCQYLPGTDPSRSSFQPPCPHRFACRPSLF